MVGPNTAGYVPILISQRLYAAVESAVDAEPVSNVMLKGLSKPITAFSVRSLIARN